MRRDFEAYFDEDVIPLIAREHPDLMSEMSIRVEGSLGFGTQDELSDVDVTLFLPEKLWWERGGQLQLTLLHKLEPLVAQPAPQYPPSHLPRDPCAWWDLGHSEISVHRLSELLCGQAERVLAGEADVPWEEVPLEELLQLQIHPILRDGHGALARLRELTAPERYPSQLWVRNLIGELIALAGELQEFRKAVHRTRPLEAHLFLAEAVRMLFRVIFLVNRQYYPWRGGFLRMFRELPFGPGELLGEFEMIGSGAGWSEKSAAVDRIVRVVTAQILDSGMLSADMLKYLLHAWGEKAWENPGWLDRAEAYGRQAEEAGYDARYGWIWDQWRWRERGGAL
jgi:hypothetical protein